MVQPEIENADFSDLFWEEDGRGLLMQAMFNAFTTLLQAAKITVVGWNGEIGADDTIENESGWVRWHYDENLDLDLDKVIIPPENSDTIIARMSTWAASKRGYGKQLQATLRHTSVPNESCSVIGWRMLIRWEE